MKDEIALHWFRQDLRIKDNEALSYATQNHEIVTALYVYNKIEFDGKREAQKWWLFKSLKNLQKDLKVYNINLEVLLGDDVEVLAKIKNNQDISIYANKVYEPSQKYKETKISSHFNVNKINKIVGGYELILESFEKINLNSDKSIIFFAKLSVLALFKYFSSIKLSISK